ncbi:MULTISPECIES: nitrilase-related carbon-nitrogen hydrolase [Streptomyces]|uniref:Hydrolase n=1 Tax=Streptomyces spinosisporus TaxID=2927582 RepID=A0ABS9XQ27_9ACTN|nr:MULTISPECIES: nitrilase-related carbon-nitrogen hydrolase [Streptomyces]MCI3244181.1 hydrolase [Streptomyces spinosisporus]WUB40975.1 hydrolase [Streptomyces sp. NBC_00588]
MTAPALNPDSGVARVVCEQLAPRVGDLAHNMELALDAVRRARSDRADIVVLPELTTSGYVFADTDEARRTAITPSDAFFADLTNLLAGTRTVAVLGFCEDAGPTLYNSAAVVDADGVRAVYRKTHLWDRETLFFTPGEQMAPVVTTPHGRIGVLICYDLEFPEMSRRLATAGADLIAVPTNWPLEERPDGERPAEIVQAQAAARANGVYIACADRSGTERGQAWTQGTSVINQYGWITATAGATDGTRHRAVTDVFLHLARDKSLSPHNDLLRDRRTDLYAQESPQL